MGEISDSATDLYGLKVYDGSGTADSNILVKLGGEGNTIGGWTITNDQIQSDNLIIHSSGRLETADFASGVFERFDDKQVLLIGAGKMAAETLRYLRDAGSQNIRIINRSMKRAHSLAQRLEAQIGDFGNMSHELVNADLVVSTTGATEPVVTLDLFQKIQDQREGRPLVVLDLAVPRDFDSRIGTQPGVWLYSIDDLGQACDSNRRRRQKQLPAALTIVDEETRRFMGDLHHRSTVPVIEQLRAGWNETGEVELDQLLHPQLPAAPAQRSLTSAAVHTLSLIHI